MYRSYDINVTVLLTGNDELADGLASMIPEGIAVIRDPLAHQVASSLQIQSTPFAVIVSEGQIQNKSYLFSHQTLIQLTQNRIPLNLA
ncbi:MAG: hypothetical protein D6706_17335 [Chloroflexi bacterium]|nr:MAG: hypothetical protein D6706_17335 [Chloroflexota bacterium]